jgi:hypothetical protein
MAQKMSKPHRCDTDNPQRPCCWEARIKELDAMRTPEAIARQKAAAAAHDARLVAEGGFMGIIYMTTFAFSSKIFAGPSFFACEV